MCRVDLHVHTRRYSECAEFLDPWELGAVMIRQGLVGLVLTEHDAQWQPDELSQLRDRCYPARVYAGVECTAVDGHVIGIGLRGPVRPDKRRTVAQTVALIRQLGGCSILVHPLLSRPWWPSAAPPGLDAIEVVSTVTQDELARATLALAERWGLPAVGGSDAHALARVGYCWTSFDELPRSEQELAQLLRSGAGRPATAAGTR